MLLRQFISQALRAHGKVSFLSKLPARSKILDVGCGNDSPFLAKQILPQSEYTGIDIGNYNHSKPNRADHYIVTSPSDFTSEILKLPNSFDAVISAHNLEHCDNRSGTFLAMLGALKPGGQIYLSFPCEDSVNFPKREGTLNYFDDETHKSTPPNFQELVEVFGRNAYEIVFSTRGYKPGLLWSVGMLCEPVSAHKSKVALGTWEYWGFESIIWARKSC